MSEPTSVCFVDHTSTLGGAELSLARFLRWPSNPLEISLAILSEGDLNSWAIPARVPIWQHQGDLGTRQIRKVATGLEKFLSEVNPSIVVANSLSAAQYLSVVPKAKRRYYYYARQEVVPVGMRLKNRLFLEAVTLRRMDGFIVNSRWTESTIPPKLRERKPVKVAFPVSGLGEVMSPPARPAGPLRVLTLSRLAPWKGIHVAVDAFIEAHGRSADLDIRMTVAGGPLFGEESYEQDLHSRALRSGAPIEFVGHVADVRELLRSHDVLLCPSTTPEPFGQVIVQGLANGLVVVATDQGGPKEILKQGFDGILFPAEAPSHLASILIDLASNAELREFLGRNGLETAKRYTDQVTTGALSNLLHEIAR